MHCIYDKLPVRSLLLLRTVNNVSTLLKAEREMAKFVCTSLVERALGSYTAPLWQLSDPVAV